MADLPVLGAAMTLFTLERLRNWLFESERDVELQDFHMPDSLDGDWRPLAERSAALLAGHRGRIGIHGPFWSLPLDPFDREIAAVTARRMNQGLDICAMTGATQMVVHSPFTHWDVVNRHNFPRLVDDKIDRVRRTLGPVVSRAEDQGVTLVIENCDDSDPEMRRALALAFDSPAVRLSIDTGHAHCAHGVSGAPPVDYFVASAGALLDHVHVQDTDAHADRHWLPGDGSIRWHAVFDALRALSVRPRLILEMRDHARIVEAAGRLSAMGLAA